MDLSVLSRNTLFSGIPPEAVEPILKQLCCKFLSLKKGENLIEADEEVHNIYILLKGRAHAIRTDYSGREVLFARMEENSIIGDLLAAGKNKKSLVTVTMAEPSEILSIPFHNLLSLKERDYHVLLLQNLIGLYSKKYFSLLERVDCLTAATLREKILLYLSEESRKQQSEEFIIPFDRQAFAAYLNADRSALSRELSYMKKEGLIDYRKNSFKLLKKHF